MLRLTRRPGDNVTDAPLENIELDSNHFESRLVISFLPSRKFTVTTVSTFSPSTPVDYESGMRMYPDDDLVPATAVLSLPPVVCILSILILFVAFLICLL
jgi:hypothetical protein